MSHGAEPTTPEHPAELARWVCRLVRVELGSGPAPEVVARSLGAAPGVVCLSGSWAGGGAIVAAQPLIVSADPADLGHQPQAEPGGSDEHAVGGGWFGYVAYSGPSALGFYDHVLRLVDGRWWFEALVSRQRATALDARRAELAALLSSPPPVEPPFRTTAFAGPPAEEHLRAVESAIAAIRAGDLYQVNVCTRLNARCEGDGLSAYARLARLAAPYTAYVRGVGGREVVAASPELFLRRRGRQVWTSPIKGTAPRVGDGGAGAAQLRGSAKDAAENVMIVDLMRNDLGRVCTAGSVRPVRLLDLEPHPGLWHLVSTVTGELRPGVGDGELLAATFPPGSVTGAPKVRAQREIAALEPTPRGVYTGAIGFASPVAGAEFAVAIRTFELAGGRIELGVGGGVTADSVPMLEWRECGHKSAPLLAALGAPPVSPALVEPTADQLAGGLLETVQVRRGRPVRLGDHLARLHRSARELYGAPAPADLAERVRVVAATSTSVRAVLRIVLRPPGVELSVADLPDRASAPGRLRTVVRASGGMWRHKWADRQALTADEAGGDLPLYVADDGTVLETSRGNVFLLGPAGEVVTAPLRDDLLPGVTRAAVLDLARDAGRRLDLRCFGSAELLASPAFWTSSLSGAVPIVSVDGVALPRADADVAALAGDLGGASVFC